MFVTPLIRRQLTAATEVEKHSPYQRTVWTDGILCHSYCSAHGTCFANFHCTSSSYQTVKSHSGSFRRDARY